jgi:hypothetical protein
MPETSRNVMRSCLTMIVVIGVILSLVVVAGMGVMIFTLLARA